MNNTPKWYEVARSYLGLKEIPGPRHNSTIQKWLFNLKAWWRDDETPWCGVFVGQCFSESGFEYPAAYFRARAWLDWGVACEPCLGAVCVLERGNGGHVGFVVAQTQSKICLIGGNQDNEVNERWYPKTRVLGYRRPPYAEYPPALPFLNILDEKVVASMGRSES